MARIIKWNSGKYAHEDEKGSHGYLHYSGFCPNKKEGKDQESIQSSTIPGPGYQWESANFTIRDHKRETRGKPFSSRWQQGINNIRARSITKTRQKFQQKHRLGTISKLFHRRANVTEMYHFILQYNPVRVINWCAERMLQGQVNFFHIG